MQALKYGLDGHSGFYPSVKTTITQERQYQTIMWLPHLSLLRDTALHQCHQQINWLLKTSISAHLVFCFKCIATIFPLHFTKKGFAESLQLG